MYYQTLHNKKLVEGAISRTPYNAYDFISGNSLLSSMAQGNPPDAVQEPLLKQMVYLADHNFRYIVLHKPNMSVERIARWRAYFALPPVYEDDLLIAYETDVNLASFSHLDETFSAWVTSPMPETAVQADWLTISVVWMTQDVPQHDWRAAFVLTDATGQVVQEESYPFSVGRPTSSWKSGTIVFEEYLFQIDPFLSPGDYQLHLSLVDPRSDADDLSHRGFAVGTIGVTPLPRAFKADPSILPGGLFGNEVCLLGYDLVQTEDDMILTLYRQAVRRMDESYKVFVHLFDPATGATVAQDDAVPRGWTYPTMWWEKGKVVSDEIVLSLQDAPAGLYRLAVGVYHQESGERLPVIDAAGKQQPDGRLVLPEEIVR